VSFLAPLLLLGALGVAVPIVIHLIGRQRAKVVRFAAIDFLFATRRKTSRRLRLRERLLLVVRTLVALAIPLALAKPFTSCARPGPKLERGPQAAVLVVDDSFASGYRRDGRTVLQRAIEEAGLLLHQLGPEAEVAVVRASEGADNPGELTRDHLRVRDRLHGLEPTSRPPDLTRALARAAQLLSGSNHKRRTVFLLSALAKAGFRPGERPWGDDGPALAVIDLADKQPLPNRAVTRARVEPDPGAGSRGIAVTAEIANFAREPAQGVDVALRIAGRIVARGKLDLAPGQRTDKRFLATLPAGARAADAVIELDGDALAADDRRWLRAQLRDEIRVLLVDGDPRTVRHDDELFYLEAALRPGDRSDTGTVLTKATVDDLVGSEPAAAAAGAPATPGARGVDLDSFDVIVLANVRAMAAARVAALERWVKAGGGLLVGVGSNVDAASYERTMLPLMPQSLRDPIDIAYGAPREEMASRAVHLTKWEADHPIFAPFAKDAPGLDQASFSKIMLLGPTTQVADRKVLARFTNGAAALVEASSGDGRLMLWTSTLDRDWNDLSIHPGYLPLVQGAVRHLARRQNRTRADEVLVGHSAPLATLDLRKLEVRDPGGGGEVFDDKRLEGRTSVRYGATERPGIYRVVGTDRTGVTRDRDELDFAVNLDPRGSDLTRIEDAALPKSGSGEGHGQGQGQQRVELWHAVAAGLLLLLLLESILIQR